MDKHQFVQCDGLNPLGPSRTPRQTDRAGKRALDLVSATAKGFLGEQDRAEAGTVRDTDAIGEAPILFNPMLSFNSPKFRASGSKENTRHPAPTEA
jgi:hypothetical protein